MSQGSVPSESGEPAGYRTTTVPVDGGELAVGLWGPDGGDAPTVLAVHGITATHRAWPWVAAALPGVRVVAPDLRGRGRSSALPGPYGMTRHAADLEVLLDVLGVGRATVVGHSMGGFVAVALTARVADRLDGVVLVDGGLPLVPAPGAPPPDPDASPEDVLGPAARRLTMTFESREGYRDFWRAHPAFAGRWNAVIEAYVDYDLEGEPPSLTPSTPVAAMLDDAAELVGGTEYDAWLAALGASGVPVSFLRAPRGLMDEPQALYEPGAADRVADLLPNLRAGEVAGVNHYTVVMAPEGAAVVADAVRALLPR